MTIHGIWFDEHLLMEESNVMHEDWPSQSVARPRQSKRMGKLKRDAHQAIHKTNVKKKNRAKNRVAKAARKKGRK